MPNTKLSLLLAFVILVFASSAFAQKTNLARDFAFFEKKLPEYNRWLQANGLGNYLQTDLVRMRPILNANYVKIGIDSNEMEMFLLLRTTDPDTAIAMWKAMQSAFQTQEGSLEDNLYRVYVHKMEIPAVQGNIQVYIRDKNGILNKCFYVFIWQESDPEQGAVLKYKYNFNDCKAKSFEIDVKTPTVKKSAKGKSTRVTRAQPKSSGQVFNIIRKYVADSIFNQPRYRTTECNDRKPHFETDSARTEFSYHFTLADLGREVLKNQYRSSWEKFWGYNTIAMERLTFDFEYRTHPDGFTLKCTIDGKYGSGVFKPRTTGYMNMENDFNDFFETYKNKVYQDLKNRL